MLLDFQWVTFLRSREKGGLTCKNFILSDKGFFLWGKRSSQICKTKILLRSLKSNQKLGALMNNSVLCENIESNFVV